MRVMGSKFFDLVPKWNFLVVFDDDMNTLISTFNIEIKPNYQKLVLSIDVPELEVAVGEEIQVGATKFNLTGDISIPDFDITFHNDITNTAKKLYYGWINKIIDKTTGAKYPRSSYERSLKVYIYPRHFQIPNTDALNLIPDLTAGLGLGGDSTGAIELRTYYRCYPISMSGGKYDYSEGGFADPITIKFKCNGGMDFSTSYSL